MRPRSPTGRTGQPGVLGGGVCRGTRCAHSVRSARTTTASQFTMRACPSARPPPHPLRAPGASRRGDTGLRVARPPCRRCARQKLQRSVPKNTVRGATHSRTKGRAKQWPVCGTPPSWLRRGAQEARRAGVPKDTPASSSDWLRLSERSAPARSEFHGAAPRPSTAGCPVRRRRAGTQTAGSPFLCLRSFGEAKESKSAAGPRPGPGKKTPPIATIVPRGHQKTAQ